MVSHCKTISFQTLYDVFSNFLIKFLAQLQEACKWPINWLQIECVCAINIRRRNVIDIEAFPL